MRAKRLSTVKMLTLIIFTIFTVDQQDLFMLLIDFEQPKVGIIISKTYFNYNSLNRFFFKRQFWKSKNFGFSNPKKHVFGKVFEKKVELCQHLKFSLTTHVFLTFCLQIHFTRDCKAGLIKAKLTLTNQSDTRQAFKVSFAFEMVSLVLRSIG